MAFEKIPSISDEGKKRVRWRSGFTGAEGEGELLPPGLAEEWAKEGNDKHPEIKHWTKKA